jgi:hypothetical protein
MLADFVKDKWGKEELTVVSPDSGRVRVADARPQRRGRWSPVRDLQVQGDLT